MIEIIPAIMPKSFTELREKMALVEGIVPLVQLDIMDGIFVPNKSWPYIGQDSEFGSIISEKSGFPFWQEIDFEADLMVSNPEKVSQEWIKAGAKRIIIHVESTDSVEKIISKIKSALPEHDSFLYTEIGVALNPDTPNEKIYPLMNMVDFVQFMGIKKIGFQGEPFDERVLEKIDSLRQKYPNATISVDGGVSSETAPRLIEVGVNRLAVGSAIFESEDIVGAIEEFQQLSL